MTTFLVVTCAAPFASFGEEAGNVERGTAARPTRSALLGLAGAALGIERQDREGQAALGRSFRIATRTLRAGRLTQDFHTFQSLPGARGRPATRRDALSHRGGLETSITRRSYLADVVFQIAYAEQPDASVCAAELASAFRTPRFVLSLGRRSCPLAAPLAPREIEAADVVAAFRIYAGDAWKTGSGDIAVEDEADLPASNRPRRSRIRLDEPVDRSAWLFSARREWLVAADAKDQAASHD
ncbi:type I-E CRISPR-associated protein Cas5/CasD [Afifella sp. H1R]|uniref:type I-E CRISPR-associated protein Cas5/CasD n=1 Tax=Afifella sp. H1R TaxID=2908841 RepID=UPI001F2A0474|nr:type I-E CRISPR-associated protein Cas5/CasD [Afifella sp. H1R]MCF1506013.1 type I-E CRISPR-associated protein Cas5/CasD [Afifella sp. H1R]